MSEQILQVIRNWTIRRKILTGFAIALLATGVVGAYAIRQLDRMHSAVVSAQGGGMVDAIYQDSRSFILILVASGVILGLLAALFLARLIAVRDRSLKESLDRYEAFGYKQWLRVYMRSKMIKHNKDLFESLDDTFALLEKLHIY